ncbi:MAG TPA: acyltransferase [Dermatophilaceae bacterium]|nr:acyltransferase [Dermatophilaceae bacterium]
MSPTVAATAAATPSTRDRWADALRVGSLLVVIIGHWFMVAVTPEGEISNALKIIPSLQPVTWVLQVMPLFFLVGGVAHAHTLDRLATQPGTTRGRYAAFIRARAVRLMRPTLAFLAVWVGLGAIAHVAGLTSGGQGRLVTAALVMVPQLLWFVGIYLGIAAFAPAMVRAHRRWGLWAAAVLVVAAVLVDVVRFGAGVGIVGNLNFALVWLAVHQFGFAWRDGSLTPRVAGFLAVVGAAGLVAAVTFGPYPTSMVGLSGDEISNMAPPTAALLAQGLALIGVAALARPRMARVLARPRAWRLVVTAGAFAMTAFLWHLTALLATLLTTRALGMQLPDVGTATWWWTRPLWVIVLAIPTAALVALFLRFDLPTAPGRDRSAGSGARSGAGSGADGILAESRTWVDPLAAVATAVTVFGVLMVSIVGVDLLGNRPQFFLVGDVTPVVAFAVLAVGLVLLLQVCRPARARG